MFDIKGWVRLGEGEDSRIRDGHLWIYRNEITDTGGDFSDGDIVWVEDSKRRKLGSGLVNLQSLISVRMLSRGASDPFSQAAFSERLDRAVKHREHLTCDARRLVNAEGDLLPGLIVDQYRNVAVLQLQVLAWEMRKDFVIAEIERVTGAETVILKNESPARKAEGLDRYTEVVKGTLDGNVVITEHGLTIEVDVLSGQKTGFYVDQRDNRRLVLPYVSKRRVLDCCCYTGAWSLMCRKAGATHVRGVDASQAAVDLARRNAQANAMGDATEFTVGDIFDDLQHLAADREKFGAIVLDPPSLARTRKAITGAERGYTHLNKLALGLLEPGGVLVTCSCSHHISADRFREILMKAASLARKRVAHIKTGGQPEDHPSLLGLPETNYLKCMVLQVP
ncbi:MAG: class I SAM-dependent rRNA methyltransferase [Candidatus Eisenbacteria bacterium]